MEKRVVKISVRTLVEFILRAGDISAGGKGMRDTNAMQKGSKIHRKIQNAMGGDYRPEVSLSLEMPMERDGVSFSLVVEGRADGIFTRDGRTVIDEIKGMYLDVLKLEEPFIIHQAQAKCYGYIYALENNLKEIEIQMTYCNLEEEEVKRFQKVFSFEALKEWYENLINEYAKWAVWQIKWEQKRNDSIKGVDFPFLYREGQKELVKGVYQTILRQKKLYIEAPTGVGKTISTVFPAVKAMGEELVEKIFYLTAKTITRTVAEETFHILRDKGMKLKVITLTAKEKICILDKPDCNPASCERAKGHYDRVNDAVYDMLVSEDEISRELIEEYALRYQVCPMEMALDVTLWADAVICDYNYVFDPKVSLRRFFQNEKKHNYCFLVDEAHNLVERGREMYSAILLKDDFLAVKRIVKMRSRKLDKRLSACNRKLLLLRKEWEEAKEAGIPYAPHSLVDQFVLMVMNAVTELDNFLNEFMDFEGRDKVLELYFDIFHFLNMYEIMNDKYKIYLNEEDGHFFVKLQCMDPSDNLKACLEKGRSGVFFSATFLPIQYYKEQLAGTNEDYAVYVPSPFDVGKRRIFVAKDVSTKYTRRNYVEYEKVVSYIYEFVTRKKGNYLVFFPSYQYMKIIYDYMEGLEWQERFQDCEIIMQDSHMTEREKEEFLENFEENSSKVQIGFCVMGGIFSEGIDLKKDRLIGAVIVGTGLPMVCDDRELFRSYYEERESKGFEFAYLYNGMNKVLQSAGRVIRTAEDVGVILLLDERFMQKQYTALFPQEWYPYEIVSLSSMKERLDDFWRQFE
ncbi:ATP-dependent DNA helicase [[Clostridium] polysaccharolyticum]|uniref:Rad3-related DNA helicase n=1 Tax=[Clostridium] polysaccharolyticum TaxID=29364 RepID=A0A1H9YM10_9FIRM|nr:ATP-dependent DNA helicase [[Clostridium] polysaccharolyticum]SES70086.1 Rad3-related DNA helicase [[Clostridium] polysaccharolyticum]